MLTSKIGLINIAVALTLILVSTCYAANRIEYYHTDALGSVIASTDEDGNVLWNESYKPFGGRIQKEVSTDDNTPFYTGKPHDDTTGLSYFGARYYDPYVGRFTGIDPAGVDPANLHSFNRYAYANNNPYKYVDPNGKLGLFLHSFQRGLSREDAMAVSGMGNAALTSTAASMAVVIDEGSDYVNPIKGIIKKGVKEVAKEASKEITKSSRKRVKRLIKDLSDNSRQNNGLSQED